MQAPVTDASASPAPAKSSASSARILFHAVAILSLIGAVVSAIAVQRHYAKSATAFCEFAEKFNCDIVNRSEYSSIEGIPVAAIGVAGYGVLFVLSTFWKARQETQNRLLLAAITGLAFALYLTYVEAYVLTTWCILCVTSLIVIGLISVLAIVIKLRCAKA
jgi:vitamin-K-epoxide reductase (warfarin-sensitive)